MRITDTTNWTVAELQEFAEDANRTVDEVAARGEDWDAFIRRVAPDYDLIQAIWRDPKAPRGFNIGIIKGEGKLMLIAQGKKSMNIRKLRFRLPNQDCAEATWVLYGDGRSQVPEAGHLLSMHLNNMGVTTP